jgi:hypothetical protein
MHRQRVGMGLSIIRNQAEDNTLVQERAIAEAGQSLQPQKSESLLRFEATKVRNILSHSSETCSCLCGLKLMQLLTPYSLPPSLWFQQVDARITALEQQVQKLLDMPGISQGKESRPDLEASAKQAIRS